MNTSTPRNRLKGPWHIGWLMLALGAVATTLAQTSVVLPSPLRSRYLPSAFTFNADVSAPVVSNGYAISHAWVVYPEKRAGIIYLTSLATGQETTLSLPSWLVDRSVIRLEAVSLTASGQVVLAGTSLRSTEADDITNFVDSPTFFER